MIEVGGSDALPVAPLPADPAVASGAPARLAPPFALFDDSLDPQGRSLLLTGLVEQFAASCPAEVDATLAAVEAAAAAGRHVALVADYELGYWLEPKVRGAYVADRPLLQAWVFEHAATMSGADAAALLAGHVAALPADAARCGLADFRPRLDAAAYAAGVQRILDYIREGDCYQVNFTFPLEFRHYGDATALYARLRAAQPVRYGACLRLPGTTLLSLSPELFVERRDGRLIARPMKGTARRDRFPESDLASREALASSEKNRAENLMIVDLIRNDLGRVAATGSVRVDRLFEVERFPTVWQMTSTVSADAGDASLIDIFRALFPCGSITGAPKVRAMQIAAELEPGPRGVYTGAIGVVRPGGDFAFNVPIRTLALDADGHGRLGIGSGIVADSEPRDERAECLLKARFATGLPVDFQLIETLLLEPAAAAPFPRLAAHLRRLAESAAFFAFACDPERIAAALLRHAQDMAGGGRQRTRLLLHKNGETTIASTPLPPAASEPPLLVFAATAIDSRSLFRAHKTTVRGEYDAELAQLAGRPEILDAIFLNERGEVAEGARTTLFADVDGVLATPPLSAGALPGVLRRELIDAGRAVERTLLPADLRRADALYAGNSVRGLVPVRLADAA